MADGFKAPSNVPQDLLLIQEFIDVVPVKPVKVQGRDSDTDSCSDSDDDISSSGSESGGASEEEVVADLIREPTEDENTAPPTIVSKSQEPSDSETSSDSDSDSEDSDSEPALRLQALDDDEDPLPAVTSGTYFQTKHELHEAAITIPEVEEVGVDEVLEKVGEVMNIIDRVAIVQGLPSDMLNRGSDRALDSDTLLVFDDRKVMGYIYETFGPTTQPLYQIKFNSSFPLDPERVKVGREVFHVPARSHFVFVNQIKAFKGSDASNVHDEEPGEDEIEFSDDEAEAAYRSRLKRKRGDSRARSVASSRQATPNPSQMRDQELAEEEFYSRNAFDEQGPYDVDFSAAGPSRPMPIPYDDPYGDAYTAPDVENKEVKAEPSDARLPERPVNSGVLHHSESQSRGRGRPGRQDRDNHRDRGRGRERGRGRGRGKERSSQPQYGGGPGPEESRGWSHQSQPTAAYEQRDSRSISPTSLAIARATGQMAYSPQEQQQPQQPYSPMFSEPMSMSNEWGYGQPQAYQQQFGYMQQPYQQSYQQPHGYVQTPFVQPHINPRFASAFGLAMNAMQQQGLNPIPPSPGVGNSHTPPSNSYTENSPLDQWTVGVERSPQPEDQFKNNGL